MNIVIIENEALLALDLSKKIERTRPGSNVVAIIKSIEQGKEWFTNNVDYDLIFSDIKLNDGLAFELLSFLNPRIPVVFVTAYNEYALTAFKFNSIHYLLKPISEYDVKEVFEKYDRMPKASDYTAIASGVEKISDSTMAKRLFIKRGDDTLPIKVEDVSGFFSSVSMTVIYTKDGKEILCDETLKVLEEKLDPVFFKRISRQWIINIDAIVRMTNSHLGSGHIILMPNIDISLSKDKFREVYRMLTNP